MLGNEIIRNELYNTLSEIASQLGMDVVDINKTVHASEIHISITIQVRGSETGIDDCERFHRTVQPRLELEFGRDNLSMEVSTPGIQRSFRDCHEFSVFFGKRVRVYVLSLSSYAIGTISETDSESVLLTDVYIEDKNAKCKDLKINFNDIQKAKLEYVFASDKEKHNV